MAPNLPNWWNDIFGAATIKIPDHSIAGLYGLPAYHTFYTYLFRPNYDLRREVHKLVKEFDLDNKKESCATMHVRRGDIVEPRTYIVY